METMLTKTPPQTQLTSPRFRLLRHDIRGTQATQSMLDFCPSGAHLTVFQCDIHRDDVGVRRVHQDGVDL